MIVKYEEKKKIEMQYSKIGRMGFNCYYKQKQGLE